MKLSLLVFFTFFVAIAYGAEASRAGDLELGGAATPLLAGASATVQRTHRLLEADYERNVGDLIQSRWFFRKAANFSEGLGNTLLYIGSGAASVAAGIKLIGSEDLSNIFLFASTACFAAHITFIGIAKCSSREQSEREKQLVTLADEVGFKVVSLETRVTDDGE